MLQHNQFLVIDTNKREFMFTYLLIICNRYYIACSCHNSSNSSFKFKNIIGDGIQRSMYKKVKMLPKHLT